MGTFSCFTTGNCGAALDNKIPLIITQNPAVGKYRYLSAMMCPIGTIFKTGSNAAKKQSMNRPYIRFRLDTSIVIVLKITQGGII